MTTDSTMPLYGGLADRFADVAQSLLAAQDLNQSFESIVGIGVATIGGAEHAGITVLRRGKFDTPAASGPLPRQVDAIQYELGTGPCVDSALDGHTYRTGDLSTDERWPEFGTRAATETGVLSMLSFRLFLEEDDAVAALNLYSTQPDAFDDRDMQTGLLLATHTSIAMSAAQRQEQITNLEVALASSRDIGIGIGVLMTRHLLTRDQAFNLLRIASQHSHRKLRDIAREVSETGVLDLPAEKFSDRLATQEADG
jgi:GAF domain-containing protein